MLLGSDTSTDPEDIRDELRTELLLLNTELKQINPDFDFSDALRPLLADTGPAVAHVPRLQKQKARMEKIRDDFLRKAEEKRHATPAVGSGSSICLVGPRPSPSTETGWNHKPFAASSAAEPFRLNQGRQAAAPAEIIGGSMAAASHSASCPRPGRRGAPICATIVPEEVLPPWGPLKRYSDKMERRAYDDSCRVAEWTFRVLLAHAGGPREGGPAKITVRSLPTLAAPEPPVQRGSITSFFSNRYLQFDNIRAAAEANKFDLIQIGWLRNEALVAQRVATNEGRNAFIAWAVALLQSLGHATSVNYKQDDLLAHWNALPESEQRESLDQSQRAILPYATVSGLQ